MTARLPPLAALRTFEAAARHRNFSPRRRRTAYHPRRDQPSDEGAGARTRRGAVPPAQPRRGTDRAGPRACRRGARGAGPHRPRRRRIACASTPRADGQRAAGVRHALADPAPRGLQPASSRHRHQRARGSGAGGFCVRGCRSRGPLRRREMAWPHRGAVGARGRVPGVQSALQRRSPAEDARANWRRRGCCTRRCSRGTNGSRHSA